MQIKTGLLIKRPWIEDHQHLQDGKTKVQEISRLIETFN